MRNVEDISKIIKDAQDLESLIDRLFLCLPVDPDCKCARILETLKSKMDSFRKDDRELQQMAARSMHSERLAAMGQMAAAISHELRNPLSGIKVAAEYLLRKLNGHPELADIVNNIHSEVIFANNIISNILEHARIGKPKLEPAKLKNIIEEAILTVAQQGAFNNIEIKHEIDDDLPVLDLDASQIRQIFMNMFINSAEAMNIGGGVLRVSAREKDGEIIVKIADNGSGIEEKNLEKIFEPFFSTKVKGTGLGLAVCKEIIENHLGRIYVESKPGKGAIFIMTFPVKKDSGCNPEGKI